jgi:hypothetical protein
MAGTARPVRPTSGRVAANIRRMRRDRELTTGALSRRLAELGHPIADTGITKIEKGQRGVDVDDLVALAIALRTTPNRLLLPEVDGALTDGTLTEGTCELTPQFSAAPPLLWAWAAGEVPLGRQPASAGDERAVRGEEVVFGRENRQHLWNAPAPSPPPSSGAAVARTFAVTGLTAFVKDAFASGLTTADIRAAVEGALVGALISPDPTAPPRIEVGDGAVGSPP